MPAKHHPKSEKMAAVVLARQTSPDQAALAMGIDARTIAGWLQTVEVPDSAWGAIEATLLARAAEMTAKGETRGLVAILTGAGIADRNVRYSTLIARREARREAEAEPVPTNPIHDAINALDPRRQALVGLELRAALEDRDTDDDPPSSMSDEESDASFLAYLAEIASLSEEQLSERLGADDRDPGWDGLAGVRDAIDAMDGPAGDGNVPPALPVVLVEDGSPEGTRSRLAVNVTPGAPEPVPEPEIGKDGTWVEVDRGEPWQWEAWKRYET